ncbi:biopolymer transport protein TolR [Desulfosarcina sp. BuS5]|uniref:protein TolR n=1 Tax=Desulfosarcina sp. BuS5 TaxID=933262 RepID=UPI00048902BD|nr:protein TolR [Desulfosarcina sp. BuS5]WDN89172.1 biopolymer transport protein TolR [Desulfosarcina sp. BuS5]
MIYKGNNDNLMSDINVTPFVDVMLVLLIIFMVTAPMMVQGVNVSLPEAAAKSLPAQAENLVITIAKNGGIYINDYQVEFNFLQEKLSKIMGGRKDREVFLKADKEISYGMVVRVMSEIKNAGVEKIGMVTEPASTKKNRKKA